MSTYSSCLFFFLLPIFRLETSKVLTGADMNNALCCRPVATPLSPSAFARLLRAVWGWIQLFTPKTASPLFWSRSRWEQRLHLPSLSSPSACARLSSRSGHITSMRKFHRIHLKDTNRTYGVTVDETTIKSVN